MKHTEEYSITWEGIALSIRWTPNWLGRDDEYAIGHLEIESDDRHALPMTETGYRSHFTHRDDIDAYGGAVAFVDEWLKETSRSKSWKAHVEASKQLSLF